MSHLLKLKLSGESFGDSADEVGKGEGPTAIPVRKEDIPAGHHLHHCSSTHSSSSCTQSCIKCYVLLHTQNNWSSLCLFLTKL